MLPEARKLRTALKILTLETMIITDKIDMTTINLEEMKGAAHALTKSWAESRFEAAIFCLDYNSHSSNVVCGQGIENQHAFHLLWETKIDEKIKRTWNDIQDATEAGAEGMAALFAKKLTPYEIIRRSAKKTGFDYWLGKNEPLELPFQDAARLEISGLINGTENEFKSRIKQKKIQTMKSVQTKLPAYVAITEFGQPKIAFEKV